MLFLWINLRTWNELWDGWVVKGFDTIIGWIGNTSLSLLFSLSLSYSLLYSLLYSLSYSLSYSYSSEEELDDDDSIESSWPSPYLIKLWNYVNTWGICGNDEIYV